MNRFGAGLAFSLCLYCQTAKTQEIVISSLIKLPTLKKLMEADGWTTKTSTYPVHEIELQPENGKKKWLKKCWVVLNEPIDVTGTDPRTVVVERRFKTEKREFVLIDGSKLAMNVSDQPCKLVNDGKKFDLMTVELRGIDEKTTARVVIVQSAYDVVLNGKLVEQVYADGIGTVIFEKRVGVLPK